MRPDKMFGFDVPVTPLLVVISGPSGVGKDAVVVALKERLNETLHFVITANTRERREEEVDGVDYLFVTKAEFEAMIANEELLEYAAVYDDYKGVPKANVQAALDSGKDVLMRLDVQGVETIKGLCPEAIAIFLATETEEELFERLKARKTETEATLHTRMETVYAEFEKLDLFDYILHNKDHALEETVDMVLDIIKVEHHRVHQRKITL